MATVLWGHFSSNNRPLGSSNIKDRYRLKLANQADALIAYTDGIAAELQHHIDDPNKVFVARNTLDTDVLFAAYHSCKEEGKYSIRSRLGINPTGPVILFIGRLIASKGTNAFLLVSQELTRRHSEAHIVVIGDGPERRQMERFSAKNGLSTTFTGAIPDLSMTAPYVYCSDVLLNPGYLGLSINHALSLGVPIVAPVAGETARMHSPEYEYVKTGVNGVLSPTSSVEDMVNAAETILTRQADFSDAALAYSRENLGVDNMVEGIVNALEYGISRQDVR